MIMHFNTDVFGTLNHMGLWSEGLKKVVCTLCMLQVHLINLKTDNISILWDLDQEIKEMG